MTAEPAGADIIGLVTSVPGVLGIEPGIGTTLRTLDARIRRAPGAANHFGLHIDSDKGEVVVEVCVDHSRETREIVREIQEVVRTALQGAHSTEPTILVRVQSLSVG
ncbi:hypothetical protein [Dietzia alimentaria]|uniref:hypothetical protein n=1 Tax=Dietzia alimentaria TaxID=665550 RepID=UPI00029B1F2D|nr:hypothetical protein [Dietzia alimentaria]